MLDNMDEPATCAQCRRGLRRRKAEPIHTRRCRLMDQSSIVVGLDVHKESIVTAVQCGSADE